MFRRFSASIFLSAQCDRFARVALFARGAHDGAMAKRGRPPKLHRRRKNGKFVGSWLYRVNGQDMNLDTQDANIARRRAALALAGKWPPADAAAEEAKAAFDPPPPEVKGEGSPVVAPPVGAAPNEAGAAPAQPAAAAPTVDPEYAAPGAAWNDAAAGAAEEPDETTAPVDADWTIRVKDENGNEVAIDVRATLAAAGSELIFKLPETALTLLGRKPGPVPEISKTLIAKGIYDGLPVWFPRVADVQVTPGMLVFAGLGFGVVAMVVGSEPLPKKTPPPGSNGAGHAPPEAPTAAVDAEVRTDA